MTRSPRGLAALIALLAASSCGERSGGLDLAPRDGPIGEGIFFPDRGAQDSMAREGLARDQITVDAQRPPGLVDLTLFVNLGDSLGAGYNASSGHSYKALLVSNDSALYPTYKGKDLKSLFPTLVVVDKAQSGAQTGGVVTQAKSVAGNPSGRTLVLVSAGGNDFNDNTLVMIDPVQIALVSQKATSNLKAILDHFSNKQIFPGGVTLAMLNVHDPTDGHGSIASRPNLSGFCTTILKLGILAGPIVVQNLNTFNKAYSSFATAQKVLLVDNHAAFLGHGFHFDDTSSPSYHPSDPTLWFANDCAHANDRGHHELRRLIWKGLTGAW